MNTEILKKWKEHGWTIVNQNDKIWAVRGGEMIYLIDATQINNEVKEDIRIVG